MYQSSDAKKKPDTKGVVMQPLLNIEPKHYIVPILHLLIGLVNKAWTSMGHFLDEFVENISLDEAKIKDEKIEIENVIAYLNDEIDIYTVTKIIALEEAGETDMNNSEAKELYKDSLSILKTLSGQKKKESKKLKTVKLKLELEQQKRAGNVNGIDNLLLGFLEERNIKKQHFHGGSMNGVCCRRLLDNVDVIFENIQSMVKDKIAKKDENNKQNIELLFGVIDTFKDLFECMDIVFSKLRILDPSEVEIKEIGKAIKVLEGLWKKLDLNITPKMHILTCHTLDQVIMFGGIADKVEDFVEKAHQIGKKLDHLVSRMSSQSFRQQELVKIRRQWLTSDPLVSNQLSTIQKQRKRNINYSPEKKPTRSEMHKRIKTEKRKDVMVKILNEE